MPQRDDILAFVRAQTRTPREFIPGKTLVRSSGPVYGEEELANAIEAVLEFQPAAGRWAARLERELASWFGIRHARLVNSGSSANLLAVATLCSPLLGDDQLRPGDEVITVACGFPTSVAPIVQLGLTPVFVDVRSPDYNVDVEQLELARSERTRAVMLAHTLGAPFDVRVVLDFCKRHSLWLIEDNCDAMGSVVGAGTGTPQRCGTLGHLSTLSFYPAHAMTTGEGGAVLCGDDRLARIVTSLRDWGRGCWCAPGHDNTCGRRFDVPREDAGSLPAGYDHKYVFSHLGYNLKLTDMQAAIGVAQLARLEAFGKARRENWRFYREQLAMLERYLEFGDPQGSVDPSPFGFLMTVRPESPVSRVALIQKLEAARVQTRMLFAGNMLRQPCMAGVRYRVASAGAAGKPDADALPETDRAMNDAFWIGVWPGITDEMREYVIEQVRKAVLG